MSDPAPGDRTDRLRAIDSVWLDADRGGPAVAIGSLVVCEGEPPSLAEMVDLVEVRLPTMPRLSERVVPSRALGVGRPRWQTTQVAVAEHVDRVDVDAGEDWGAVEAAVARVVETPMDLTRPLWSITILGGLPGGTFGLLTRLHHAVSDGHGAILTLGRLIDADPAGTVSLTQRLAELTASHAASRDPAGPDPTLRAQLVESVAKGGDLTVRALRRAFRDPSATAQTVAGSIGDAVAAAGHQSTMARGLLPRRATVLGGDPGTERHWRTTPIALADITTIRRAQGGTVNDVVMALMSRAYEGMLQARGQSTEDVYVRVVIPVSTRAPGNLATNNQVTGLVVQLPVFGEMTERLAWIREHINRLKDAQAAQTSKVFIDLLDVAPSSIQTLVVGTATDIPERALDSLVTNVPGPQFPLYAVGRPIRMVAPVIPVSAPIWSTIGVVSYDGVLNAGITTGVGGAEAAVAAVEGIRSGLAELMAATPAVVTDTGQ